MTKVESTVSVPTWLESLLNDVRLESTIGDLIGTYFARGDITEEQAKQASYKFGVSFPYFPYLCGACARLGQA